MIRALVNYFLTVLVRAIIGQLFFLFALGIIFDGYYFMTDFTTAIKSMKEILDTDFAHIVVWAPLVLSLFSNECCFSSKDNETTDYLDRLFFEQDTGSRMW